MFHLTVVVSLFVALLVATPAISETETGVLSAPIPEVPPTSAPRSKRLRLDVGLYAGGVAGSSTESRIAGTEVRAKLRREFFPSLTMFLDGQLNLETGMSRARYQDEFAPRQVQRLREARVQWKPWTFATLDAGAIDQERWKAPLVFQNQSFPGTAESVSVTRSGWTLSASAEQAVSSDTSTRQPLGNWPAGVPSFFLEQVSVDYDLADRFRFQAQLGHFLFQNLSAPQAYLAQFQGNTIAGTTTDDSRYAYGFQGFLGQSEVRWITGKWTTTGLLEAVLNTAAPADHNLGWRLTLAPRWTPNPGFWVSPKLQSFHVESDACPAFFNNRIFGHNNRFGWSAGIELGLPKDDIQIELQWIESQLIAPHPLQSNLNWLQLTMRTSHDL